MKGLIKAVLIMTSCRVFSPNHPTKRRGTWCQMDARLRSKSTIYSCMTYATVSIPLTTDDTEVQKNLKNWCFSVARLFRTKKNFMAWADCSVGAPPFHHSKLLISSEHCHCNVIKISHLMSHRIGKFKKNWWQNWVWGCEFSK